MVWEDGNRIPPQATLSILWFPWSALERTDKGAVRGGMWPMGKPSVLPSGLDLIIRIDSGF